MERMDDDTLLRYCNSATYNKKLCNMESIWIKRIAKVPGLDLLLPYRSHYKSLQDFYFNVRKDAHYVLMTCFDGNQLFEDDSIYEVGYNIDDIYDRFQYMLPDEDYLCVAIRFNGVLDYDNIRSYIIYSGISELPGFNNPQILQYPQLMKRRYHLVVTNIIERVQEQNSPQLLYGNLLPPIPTIRSYVVETLIEFNTSSLRLAHSKKLSLQLFQDISLGEGDNVTIDLIWMPYGYKVGLFNTVKVVLLVDLDLLGLEPANYNFVIIDDINRYNTHVLCYQVYNNSLLRMNLLNSTEWSC